MFIDRKCLDCKHWKIQPNVGHSVRLPEIRKSSLKLCWGFQVKCSTHKYLESFLALGEGTSTLINRPNPFFFPDARRPFSVMPISQNLHTGSVGYKWIESGHPLVGRREGIFWDCWTESGASYLCSSASRSPEAHCQCQSPDAHRQSRSPDAHRQSRSHYCHVSVIEASHSLTNIFLSQRCDRFYSSSNHNKRPAQAGWAGFLLKTYGRALSVYPYQL